jgi:hypothetical protein
MSCCPRGPRLSLTERHRMRVRYAGGRPVVITGPVTGTAYRFSGLERVQPVDPRDAVAFLRVPLFRFEGIVAGHGEPTADPRGRGDG